ncbi:phage holin [Bacillus sp. V26]|uniref:phage holin n=1 Tax=Bacillus sp. V26 TaxID=3098288 RepID=UPI002AACEC8A|nr:phage holin [Bacillus sp. V26]MDY7432061.1 phage holin [Bacillus sp. V26]
MFKNLDRGTVIRTVLLFIALANQLLVMFGKTVIPIDEAQLNHLADVLYTAGSAVFTLVMTLVAWFKNNYVTTKGKAQKTVLKQHSLTK